MDIEGVVEPPMRRRFANDFGFRIRETSGRTGYSSSIGSVSASVPDDQPLASRFGLFGHEWMERPIRRPGLGSTPMIRRIASLTTLLLFTLSCSTMPFGDLFATQPLRSADDLVRIDADLPGLLDLREDHGIGSYDEFLIPDATLSYKRGSRILTKPAEEVFLSLLKQTLVDATKAADISIVTEPGPCVMEIDLAVVGMKLQTRNRAKELADLTIVMEFRDSLSREPLLRYATENRVENASKGVSDKQLQRGFDRIIADLNITVAIRATSGSDAPINPECKGTLASHRKTIADQR